MVLNPTRVGNNFFSEAHISVKDVSRVKKNSHQIVTPKINPGTMIVALAAQDKNSTVL
jgi:UDP-N-acetylglucosamine enolpyruvyl transferase